MESVGKCYKTNWKVMRINKFHRTRILMQMPVSRTRASESKLDFADTFAFSLAGAQCEAHTVFADKRILSIYLLCSAAVHTASTSIFDAVFNWKQQNCLFNCINWIKCMSLHNTSAQKLQYASFELIRRVFFVMKNCDAHFSTSFCQQN